LQKKENGFFKQSPQTIIQHPAECACGSIFKIVRED